VAIAAVLECGGADPVTDRLNHHLVSQRPVKPFKPSSGESTPRKTTKALWHMCNLLKRVPACAERALVLCLLLKDLHINNINEESCLISDAMAFLAS